MNITQNTKWKLLPELKNFKAFSLPMWGMDFKSGQAKKLIKYQSILTIEDHLIDCGFGSWFDEIKAANPSITTRIKHIALSPDVCGLVGTQKKLNQRGGIAPKSYK